MSTSKVYKLDRYSDLIQWLLRFDVSTTVRLDRDKIADEINTPRHMVDLGILALSRNGAMYQQGINYTILPMLVSVTGEELTEWVTTYQRDKAQRNKHSEQLPIELPVTTPIQQFGYWQGSGFSWYDSKEAAVTSASAQALQHGGTVDLVQRIGEIKVQPTVTLF